MEYFRARYDGPIIALTAIYVVVNGAFLFLIFPDLPLWSWVMCALVLLGDALLGYGFSPRGFSVGPDALRIDRPIGPMVIPLDSIRSARRASSSELWWPFNLWGSGGFLGFFGWFWSRNLGYHRAYVTNQDDTVLVLAEQPYLLTPERPEDFLRALAQRIPRWADIATAALE